QVSCEGYDFADDSYILKDSCGLEYDLDFDYSETRHYSDGNFSHSDDSSYFLKIVLFAIIGILIYAIYKNRQEMQQQEHTDPGTNTDDSSSYSPPDTNDRTHSASNNRGGWNINWNNIGFS
ncbi:hypothetical protein, partial [Salmonella sp. s51228]|uniref:hypothetical protein n=1 Tax=Salmonella sp. s51228 TaxID=3159652 RepID=UPI003980B7D6